MIANFQRINSEPRPRRFAARRAAALLMLSAVISGFVGCASYDTYLRTAGNDTEEIDAITAEAENPVPEIHPEAYSSAPITSKSLRDGQEIQYRDVAIGEVLQIALENSEVLRELGGTILRTPETIRTRYTPGLQQTDPRFGTHAALSAFDAQFKGSASFQKNDRIFNNSFFAGGVNSYLQDLHEYKAELSKRAATGGLMIFRNVSDMDDNNAPGNLFPSAWNYYMEAEARQPLLQGGGLQYNRIAGPAGTPGLYNGILIARVNTDITQTDFEIAVRDYVSNVVNVYWDLYYSYRDLDARRRAMHAALESWRKVKAQVEAEGLSASKEAQAREQYYRFKQEVDDSLSGRLLQGTQTRNGSLGGTLRANGGVQVNERRLRLMIGLPITDGTLLRPSQDPDEAEVIYDWEILMQESLARRPELRRQQLKVKRREMELLAAQNFILPQLDAVGKYRFRGFGDKLIATANNGGGAPASALGNFATLSHQEWMAGVEFSMPIGFRQGHAAIANAEMALCHERAIHREQEREVVHDLSNALSDAVRAYESCQSSLNRYIASREVLLSLEAEEKNGLPIDIDRILDAQRRVVEAELRYYQSRTEYAIAQKNVQLERGALTGENDVWVIDGADATTGDNQPESQPLSTPPAPAPADDDAKPMTQARDAKWTPEVESAAVPASEPKPPTGPSSVDKRAMAESLMQQARRDLANGDIAAARAKAEQAAGIDVAYSVFDDRPEQLLKEIDRRAHKIHEDAPRVQRLVQTQKPAESATIPEKSDFSPFSAESLMQQARRDLANGDIAAARAKAEQAAGIDTAYSVFDDRPEQLLKEIDRRAHKIHEEAPRAQRPVQTQKPAESATIPEKSNFSPFDADALMKQARRDLANGDIAAARAKAEQAAGIDTAYSVFDDRPEQLLREIDRRAHEIHEDAPRAQRLVQTQKPAESVTIPEKSNFSPFDADALMKQARRDLANGDIAAARAKAEQAAGIDTAYSVFDDRPEQLLREIDRRADKTHEDAPRVQRLVQTQKPAESAAIPEKSNFSPFDAESPIDEDVSETKPAAVATQPSSPAGNEKKFAQQLLNQAQTAVSNGDFERARSLALKAHELNVTYDLFELRPEQVLALVYRASNDPKIVKGQPKSKSTERKSLNTVPSGANKVRPASAQQDSPPAWELDELPYEPAAGQGVILSRELEFDDSTPVLPVFDDDEDDGDDEMWDDLSDK